ncbi:hypothetical protein BKA58DRAFT_151571, partial [Alternaria rosae]|uniref:uncharacterized protein n=1 Tax=Alternaria rosae TaxID=1187941 RepID=UPI001E8E9375
SGHLFFLFYISTKSAFTTTPSSPELLFTYHNMSDQLDDKFMNSGGGGSAPPPKASGDKGDSSKKDGDKKDGGKGEEKKG